MMTSEEKILLVRLSNRLSWWFCCTGKNPPDVHVTENMTIAELDNKLSELYYEWEAIEYPKKRQENKEEPKEEIAEEENAPEPEIENSIFGLFEACLVK